MKKAPAFAGALLQKKLCGGWVCIFADKEKGRNAERAKKQSLHHAAGVLQTTQFFDFNDDGIAVLHPDLGVAAHADAVGRAGEDDVSGLEGESVGAELDQLSDAEDHFPRVALLHDFIVEEAADIENLKAKVDAGADRVLTQYFFDNACFLRFRDRCSTAGITAPIVPGILPVTDFARVAEFSRRCGVTIPPHMAAIFEPLDTDARTREMIAAGAAVSQCEDLRREGVNAFHFYTLNRARLSYAICWWLGLRGRIEAPSAGAADPNA